MKEIGLKLKEKREENGVSVEEVSEDLKVRPSQIISLEEGKKDDFKDILFLKYFIRDYAKYLGLDENELVDEFNEFLFDFTTKIPVDEIEKAKNEINDKKDIVSPYTEVKSSKNGLKILIIGVSIVALFIIGYFVFSNMNNSDFEDKNITYSIRR
ncbi:MAG: helix-turn-helix domain-containing protein [Bacilli bacterium]|nr:helix-turn-helix domain-containing protein [Bacilli bacterium]